MSPAFSSSVALPSVGRAIPEYTPKVRNLTLGRPVDFVSAMPTATATSEVSALFDKSPKPLPTATATASWRLKSSVAKANGRCSRQANWQRQKCHCQSVVVR